MHAGSAGTAAVILHTNRIGHAPLLVGNVVDGFSITTYAGDKSV